MEFKGAVAHAKFWSFASKKWTDGRVCDPRLDFRTLKLNFDKIQINLNAQLRSLDQGQQLLCQAGRPSSRFLPIPHDWRANCCWSQEKVPWNALLDHSKRIPNLSELFKAGFAPQGSSPIDLTGEQVPLFNSKAVGVKSKCQGVTQLSDSAALLPFYSILPEFIKSWKLSTMRSFLLCKFEFIPAILPVAISDSKHRGAVRIIGCN